MTVTTPNPGVTQLPLGLPPPPPSESRDARLAGLEKQLIGEMQTLRKCWKQFDGLRNVDAQSNLDTLVMEELSRSELLATVSRITNTLGLLRTSISIWTAYALTLQDDAMHVEVSDLLTETAWAVRTQMDAPQS